MIDYILFNVQYRQTVSSLLIYQYNKLSFLFQIAANCHLYETKLNESLEALSNLKLIKLNYYIFHIIIKLEKKRIFNNQSYIPTTYEVVISNFFIINH